MSEATAFIAATNLGKSYPGGIHALRGVSLTIARGEMLAIMGKSGSGKSTLLHVLGTLDRPDQGELVWDGRKVREIRNLARFRLDEIGFVFQLHYLLPHLTLLDNVALPLYGRADARERARQALTDVGLGHRLHHLPGAVSGGERQRGAVARAIVNHPRVLLADEPTGSVDTATEAQLLDLFEKLRQEKGMTLVIVTHDDNVAQRADRIIHVRDGLIEREEVLRKNGQSRELPVLAQPAAPAGDAS